MEKPAFTRVSLSNIRVIMAIMHILMVEWLCQETMGCVPVLKYLLSGARGHLWSCPIVSDIKCHRFLRFWLWWCLLGIESPRAWLPGAPCFRLVVPPSVERVAGAIHSMVGRIGTHMLLRVPPRDSVVRPCG
jgi:hypothetical protein